MFLLFFARIDYCSGAALKEWDKLLEILENDQVNCVSFFTQILRLVVKTRFENTKFPLISTIALSIKFRLGTELVSYSLENQAVFYHFLL